MNYVDLFSGIGGFALGAYWAGWRFDEHYFSEVDPFCCELYAKRFPDAIPLGDITKHDEWDLPEGDYVVTGGFPCQDISVAGAGAGIAGSRSGLWTSMWGVISKVRPRYAIIENVAALTFRGLDQVLSDLASLGYDAEWQDIRAEDVGAPHKRERIWIVAYPQSERQEDVADAERARGSSGEVHPGNVIPAQSGGLADPSISGSQGRTAVADSSRQCIDRSLEPRPARGAEPTVGDWWAVEPDVGRLAHGIPRRVDRLRGLGNSIVPQIAEIIFRQVSRTA